MINAASDGEVEEKGEGQETEEKNCDLEEILEDKTADDTDDDEEHREKYSYECLKSLDRDFFSSPRLIVRGIFRGEGLELQAKRRTEGTWVEWILKVMKTRHEDERILLSVKANMTYKYGLGLLRGTEKYGYDLDGGKGWSGYGYGSCTLPPMSDASEKHVDLEEYIWWNDGSAHHLPGPTCNNVNGEEGVTCREGGCAERIWGLSVTTFTTIMINPDSWELPRAHNLRREKKKEKVCLSYYAFHNGGHKIMITEGSTKVAWLTRANERYDEKPDVDRNKLDKHKYIWGTSLPKEDTCEENGSEKENSCQEGDDDEVMANLDYLIQELEDGASENADERENLGSGGSSRLNNYAGCEICNYRGFIAFHLRHSEGCVRQLRSKPPFIQMKGSDEVFIVKFALLAGECPSSTCPFGSHTVLPEECLEWWRTDGWVTLGWKGSREDADANVIDTKIKRFLLNQKAKNRRQLLVELQPDASSQPSAGDGASERYGAKNKCDSCDQPVDVIPHLYEAEGCLKAYMRHHLHEGLCGETVNMRKSIFHLSIMMGTCARPDCPARNSPAFITQHLTRSEDCLEFYRSEGVFIALPNWKEDESAHMVGKKITQIKRSIHEKKLKERSCGYLSFHKELSELLGKVCAGCGAMGPDAEEEASRMTICGRDGFGNHLWRCLRCLPGNNTFEDVKQMLLTQTERLKKPENQEESDFSLLWTSPQRTVLAPSSLTNNYDGPPFVAPTLSTVILVPQQPPALETLLALCDRALEQRTDLNKYAQDILRGPFNTDFGDTFACLYRSPLGNVRKSMGQILFCMSAVARGEVVSQNPNVTTAVKRNANLRMTMSGAMQEECCWSFPHGERRSMESRARSHINGRVKIFVSGTIIDDCEDDELKRILLEGCRVFLNPNITLFEDIEAHPSKETFITKMAPVILKYVRAKVKLFVKHMIAPNYPSYELRLKFDREKLKVQVEGYIWPKQFDQINQIFAANPEIRVLPDLLGAVVEQKSSLPTTTLCWRELSETYEIGELRAKKIVEVAKQYQTDRNISPLSLVNIWTPGEWSPSERELSLRAKALDLSHLRAAGENVEEAIIEIAGILINEGLSEELISEHIDIDILRYMRSKFVEMCPQRPGGSINALMWYHILLLRTGGRNQWTVKRNCGETQVGPYLPLLLEALHEKMDVRIAMTEEFLEAEARNHVEHTDRLMAGFAWTEVSILEFLHGVSNANHEEQVSETTVSINACQEEEQSFKESTEKDEEVDDIFVNSKNERYIIANGDICKLYSKRPPAVESMTLAQFATRYYKKQHGQKAVINPQTDIGPESNEPIVGGEAGAPTFVKLSNKIIMKKRSERSKPIPLLLPSNTLDAYGQHLLFQPWRTEAELNVESTEEEKVQQKQNRIALFPRSVFS